MNNLRFDLLKFFDPVRQNMIPGSESQNKNSSRDTMKENIK